MTDPFIIEDCLSETEFLDYKSEVVQKFINSAISDRSDSLGSIIKLYLKIRDEIPYDVNNLNIDRESFKASRVIEKGSGYCIPKSILLAAVARAIGIPSRLCFADVVNHIASEKFIERMRSKVFVFHSYTDLFLNGKWVKATPAFNKSLCDHFGVPPLDFNGRDDSLLQQFDTKGERFMEYKHVYGSFTDLPYSKMIDVLSNAYPHLIELNTINTNYK